MRHVSTTWRRATPVSALWRRARAVRRPRPVSSCSTTRGSRQSERTARGSFLDTLRRVAPWRDADAMERAVTLLARFGGHGPCDPSELRGPPRARPPPGSARGRHQDELEPGLRDGCRAPASSRRSAHGRVAQNFVTRSGLGCGSTISPISPARVGIRTVDVGNPMLSMHSIREMAGSAASPMIDVLTSCWTDGSLAARRAQMRTPAAVDSDGRFGRAWSD